MFTDDLVDTSVPGEAGTRSGEWAEGMRSGVRRDGMIYHCMSLSLSLLWVLGLGADGVVGRSECAACEGYHLPFSETR